MSLAKEFKEFISRGNVVDLAVGVIIGGAFGAIVSSLVKDVVMPPISYLMSGVDVSSWKLVIAPAVMGADPKFPNDPSNHSIAIKPEVDLTYGNFLQASLNFLIIAAVIFLLVKGINSLKRQEAAKPVEPPAPSAEEKLLTEIRDLLAKK
jgi:large conductance mechanosensitive channel